MLKITKGLRLHIGIFGRGNTGKSSLLNAIVNQNVSIVSDVAGTTTDPVEKVMELKPIGPVVFIDTAGVDDLGALGQKRVDATRQVIDRTELAVLVTDTWTEFEEQLLTLFKERKIPCVVAANKQDLRADTSLEEAAAKAGAAMVATTSARTPGGVDGLREMIIKATPSDFIESAEIMAGLVNPGDIVLLVTPIDIEAPKGRIQMLQSHCMREILDHDASFIVTKETEMDGVLSALKQPPNLVVCDSSCFGKVAATVDPAIPLTTFSILMARFKGDLAEMLKGLDAIHNLAPGDKVLIAEACTHHPIGEDIGRIKIPRMLQKTAGGQLQIDVVAGREYPENLSQYKVIIHCGACVFNRREMLSRIDKAVAAGIPITNYGLVIADHHGQVDRAVAPLEAQRQSVN